MGWLKNRIESLAARRYIGLYIALGGVALALVYSLVIYPLISEPLEVTVDPDEYGKLAYGILNYGTLSYYPDAEPSVSRGPLYPLFIALSLNVSGDWYPYAVQITQSVLFGGTCLLVYWIGLMLRGRNSALIASLLCAIHPFLIWYASRLWIEVVMMFLFTALVGSLFYLRLQPSTPRGILVGVILGLCILGKGTFLPFILLLPIGVWFFGRRTIQARFVVLMFLVSLVVVSPWTIRNWNLTRSFIPVHGLAGFNFQRGDSFVKHYFEAPLAYKTLWGFDIAEIDDLVEELSSRDLELWRVEMKRDSVLLDRSLARYAQHPEFMAKKIILNGAMFWYLGATVPKSLFIGLLQIPLLFFFVLGSARAFRVKSALSFDFLPIILIGIYFASYLPIFAIGRFSVVLVPTMIVYATSYFFRNEIQSDISTHLPVK